MNIVLDFVLGDVQRNRQLPVQQLLRQLHIAVIQLADTAARSGGLLLFVVHRFDDLDEIDGAVGAQYAAVMLGKLLQTAGAERLHADGGDECDQLLGFLPAHHLPHKDLGVLDGTINGAALEQRPQHIIPGAPRDARQVGGGVVHYLADAGIPIHDLGSFRKHF